MKPRNPVARELASARFRKQVVPDKRRDVKPDIEVQVCPRCQSPSQAVFVHGHYQCPVCKSVIDDCCNGETCQTGGDG